MEGLYLARVEDTVDKTKCGRVKIRIPSLHGDMPIGALPYAKGCFQGNGYDAGSMVVPMVGSYVWVMFEGGDVNKPVYLGTSIGALNKQVKKYKTAYGKEIIQPIGSFEAPTVGYETDSNGIVLKDQQGNPIKIEAYDADGNPEF